MLGLRTGVVGDNSVVLSEAAGEESLISCESPIKPARFDPCLLLTHLLART